MILLAFFFPLAIYLLILGVLNRRRRPLLVSGVWDGIGLLFGASGFLLFAGPAIFSSLSERWRAYWLLGHGGASMAGPDGAWQFWVFLSVLYFLLVVGGAAFLLWRQRTLTAIYNVEAAQVERALTQICAKLGLNPVQSGGLFLFGLSLGPSSERRGANGERIQVPHHLPAAVRAVGREHPETMLQPSGEERTSHGAVLEPTAILELDHFPLMRHVTLRWDPADCPLRPVVEAELSQCLAEMPVGESLLGGWLLGLGCLLLAFEFLGACVVILLHAVLR